MSSEKHPPGSEGEVVTFEEIPELGTDGGQGSAEGGASPEEGEVKAAEPTYKCPPNYKYDKEKKTCVKIKQEIEGPETADMILVAKAEPVAAEKPPAAGPPAAPIKKAAEGAESCEVGEVWDKAKEKCIPVKEALDSRDATIADLNKRFKTVEDALRLKQIEGTVESEIRAGRIAPVQRDKVVSFMAGLPDDKLDDLKGIFAHQKFPLQEEAGGQTSVPAGAERKGIGESESAKDLSDEDRQKLMNEYGITQLIRERGVKSA